MWGYALESPTVPSHFATAEVGEVLKGDYSADIRDSDQLRTAMQSVQPDVVFHLAAQSLVRESYASPRETFDVNVVGTASLLDEIRLLGRQCAVVVVTSDKCYENREQKEGYRETDPMGGYDPYSASKGAAELLVAAYRQSYFNPTRLNEHGVRLASARAGNVIGGGDWASDRIVPDMVKHWANGEAVPVRNPGAIRPWQHVLEPLSGYIALAARLLESDDPGACDAWNFGPRAEDEASVRELVEEFRVAWQGGAWEDASDPAQPHEAGILRLNIEKAISSLHWQPRWGLSETVKRTAGWYRRFYENPGSSTREASLADIEAYCQPNKAEQ